jgi:UDP-GlcNAc:undecaprenyl-phosphate GlcNAc-1-phosphate transferase
MMRVAPALGLVDRPSARKVHHVPLARVGGWGIVLGAATPLLFWTDLGDPLIQTYLFGAFVLWLVGTLDDSRELGHYPKFLAQFLAVIPVTTYGGLYVERVPFLEAPLPPEVGIPFTVIAMVGVINAINHSDGLDGLAGGESLLSLLAITLLILATENADPAAAIALAAIGGTLGFLRYNTHPARLFMGDSGSQFLGFTLGFLVVLLTQDVNTALSPAVAALLLGLPVIDIIGVLAQRIYHGMNWFKASKNHIHHRLLDRGFDHYESVVVIYGIQAGLVLSGVLLRFSWDWLLVAIYLGTAAAVFWLLTRAEHADWHVSRRPGGKTRFLHDLIIKAHELAHRSTLPVKALGLLVPLFLAVYGLGVAEVPTDFGAMAAVLLVVLVLELFLRDTTNSVTLRGVVYATVVFLAYLSVEYPPQLPGLHGAELAFFVLAAVAVAVAVRYSRDREFRTTPMDYLMVFVVITVAVYSTQANGAVGMSSVMVKSLVLLYACELLFIHAVSRWNFLNAATVFALAVMAIRGLL